MDVEDVEEVESGIEVLTNPKNLSIIKNEIEEVGYTVSTFELTQNPKNLHLLKSKSEADKALAFLNEIEEHEDVQKVFSNVDIPEEFLK